jgi:hypothetical protein
MKGTSIRALVVVFFLGLAACASISNLGGAEEKPDVFCRIVKEPDLMLMGSWKCNFESDLEGGGRGWNVAEYRLAKYEDKYALYFYRVSLDRKKPFRGWRAWTINGTEITSDTGVKIYTQDGQVFFVWQNGKPIKMTRIGV